MLHAQEESCTEAWSRQGPEHQVLCQVEAKSLKPELLFLGTRLLARSSTAESSGVGEVAETHSVQGKPPGKHSPLRAPLGPSAATKGPWCPARDLLGPQNQLMTLKAIPAGSVPAPWRQSQDTETPCAEVLGARPGTC